MTTSTLVISEVLERTIQGEGPSAGRLASFVRLGACNLSCGFCDTAFTWDASRFDLRQELDRRDVDEITAVLERQDTRLLVITGGEPLLQQHAVGWRRLLVWAASHGRRVEVETNATVSPDTFTAEHVAQFTASPKLGHAGDTAGKRVRPDAIRDLLLTRKAEWKFVCRHKDDVAEAAALAAEHRLPSDRVWVMPEGTTTEGTIETLRAVAPAAIGHGFNITARLHTLIWGEERGH